MQLENCCHSCERSMQPISCMTSVNNRCVQVRCACRRQKGKLRCAEARALAAARGLPAPVEGVAAALLHCDAKCRARAQVWPWALQVSSLLCCS